MFRPFGAGLMTEEDSPMYALLFVAVAILALGAAQLLGWTSDSRDSRDWQPTDGRTPARARRVRPTPISVPTDAVIIIHRPDPGETVPTPVPSPVPAGAVPVRRAESTRGAGSSRLAA